MKIEKYLVEGFISTTGEVSDEIIFSAITVKKVLLKYLKDRKIKNIKEMTFRPDGYGDYELVVKTKNK